MVQHRGVFQTVKRFAIAIIFAFLSCLPSQAAIALISTGHGAFNGGGGSSNGFTSSALDTSGANLIVLALAEALSGAGTISDSKSNTYTQLTLRGASQTQVRLWYAKNPSVGSGHTFTVTCTACFPGMAVLSFSGADTTAPFDVENGNTQTFATSTTTGSITPGSANEVVVAALSTNDTTGIAISGGGFTAISDSINVTGFGEAGVAIAFVVQTTATASNPTFTETNNSGLGAAIASFKSSSGGGGATCIPTFTLFGVSSCG